MAKKSKTQRAKASARRAEKRELAEETLEQAEDLQEGAQAEAAGTAKKAVKEVKAVDKPKATEAKKKEPGRIARFFSGVRSEMTRVTWPTRTDVIRWSGVVVAALIFFGLYVFVLDNYVVTPILLAISSLGA